MNERWLDAWFLIPTLAALALLVWALLLRRRVRSRGTGTLHPASAAASTLWEWDMRRDRFALPEPLRTIGGFERGEISSLADLMGITHPDDLAQVRTLAAELRDGRRRELDLEFRIRARDGRHLWLAVRGSCTQDERGRPLALTGTFTDITQRVEAEQERDRLFNLSIDMLAIGGFDGYLQQLNPAWVRVLGWARDDLMGRPVLEFVHPEDHEVTAAAFRALESGEPVHGLENRFRCLDGSYRWLSWSSFPYPNRRVIFSVVRDITRRKEDEDRLLHHQERMRAMSNQLALVEDRQRRHLADAIHDGLAQQLFGIRAQVTLLKYPEKLADTDAVVKEILDILDQTMADARSLSFELFPPVLYEVGLEAALVWLAKHFSERAGVDCVVRADTEPGELPEDLRAMAYQSVRELLANVSKHAAAGKVEINLRHDAQALTVEVVDDGVGFDTRREELRLPVEGSELGFGLFSIRERLRANEGHMQVDSRPGGGCHVRLTFPMQMSHD